MYGAAQKHPLTASVVAQEADTDWGQDTKVGCSQRAESMAMGSFPDSSVAGWEQGWWWVEAGQQNRGTKSFS